MVRVKCNYENPYAPSIVGFFQRQFPKAVHADKADKLELLTDVFMGTKETRQGTIPKPESLVAIRETLRKAIELNAPVPVLVPWGGRKMRPQYSIDVAEVSALKQIIKLDETLKQFHAPGLHVHIGIEDLGAEWLYKTEEGIEEYSSALVDLVYALRGETSIEPIRESLLMNKADYFRISHEYAYLLDDVIGMLETYGDVKRTDIPAFRKLQEMGWQGDIPLYQMNYYLDRYKALYPNATDAERRVMLADYWAGAKARYDLDGKGEPDSAVGSYIKLSLVPPIPGAPEGLTNNTVYWRTIPYSNGRTHIAPWRAKGYLKIDRTGQSVVKLLPQGDELIQALERDYVTVETPEGEVRIEASYLLTEAL